jgi:hypothetical protein
VHPPFEERVAAVERVAATRPWLGVVVTDHQLLADIADGYDVVILGADKWAQIQELDFYGGSARARDAALGRLPEIAFVPRPPHPVPDGLNVLVVAPELAEVSSTLARGGQRHLIVPEALVSPAPAAPPPEGRG